jgi:hypothetical protein
LGQTCEPGELRVFVVDSESGPVFDADVRIASGTQALGQSSTLSEGAADFANLPCGPLTVSAAKQGFDPASGEVSMTSAARGEITLTLRPQAQRTSVDVTATAAPIEQASSQSTEVRPAEVKILPTNPLTVAEILPLVPGIVKSPAGELTIGGSGEQRSAFVVNQSDVTDPATGKFGQTIPVDSIESVNVLATPFLAQYGRFTTGVVAVETRRGGEKWHAELNDPLPDVRIRSWHLRGIRNETPHGVLGGPLLRNRLFLNTALQYSFDRQTVRTLPFPRNDSKIQLINSFTQLDWVLSPKQIVTATFHFSPEHINFVNPDYFNPQIVTPSYIQHNYVGTVADHWGLFGGILDSSLSIQRFNVVVGSQGPDDMVLSPLGNSGDYFGVQNRDARRTEWLETWSLVPLRAAGTHLLKMGTSLTGSGDDGQFTYRPVNIVNNNGQLLERIDFSNRNPFSRTDLEVTTFAEDHWSLGPKIAFDYGFRIEHQRLPDSLRIAPRAGAVFAPFPGERTVFRAGFGQFYDHVPLNVYTFARYPQRTVTFYNPDGSVNGAPIQYINVIGSVTGPRSFFVNGEQVAGGFSPRGATWNVQMEHAFAPWFHLRGVYSDNRSVGLVVFEPDATATGNEIVLNGDGSSRYRQAEITAKFNWNNRQQLNFSYTRSHAEGSLNSFDGYLGNFPNPLVRPDVYARLPGDVPNRILLWGGFNIRQPQLQILPIVEYRSGFPYSSLNVMQDYAGVPNSNRFPSYFSLDARFAKDFKVSPKYTIRLSLTARNLSNHFNALDVHANIADPQYGVFFGNYHRRYRGDFDIIF